MRNRSFIAVAVAVTLLVAGAVALYAYDSSNEDEIANGVTVGGIDVGGMTAAQARDSAGARDRQAAGAPIAVTHGKKDFTLSAKDAEVRADVGGMVDEAVAASRSGNIISRSLRDLTGGEEDARRGAAGHLLRQGGGGAGGQGPHGRGPKAGRTRKPELSRAHPGQGAGWREGGRRTPGGRHPGRAQEPGRAHRGGRDHRDQAQGHPRAAGRQVPDAAGGGPGSFKLRLYKKLRAQEDLHRRGGRGRASTPPRGSTTSRTRA